MYRYGISTCVHFSNINNCLHSVANNTCKNFTISQLSLSTNNRVILVFVINTTRVEISSRIFFGCHVYNNNQHKTFCCSTKTILTKLNSIHLITVPTLDLI